jgi:hypothetical protein
MYFSRYNHDILGLNFISIFGTPKYTTTLIGFIELRHFVFALLAMLAGIILEQVLVWF